MSTSSYQQLVDLSQLQVDAFAHGDIAGMQQLMAMRAPLIAQLPPPTDAERAMLQRAVDLDRDLAEALRKRMMALRSTAAQVHQRRTNLNGYRQGGAENARLLNFVL
jgi:hypothetical protein